MGYDNLFDFLGYLGIGAIILLFLVVIIGFVSYIMGSLGLMRMATNEGIDNGWIAFIPVGNLYIMGKLVGNLTIADKVIDASILFPLSVAVGVALGRVDGISYITSTLAGFVSIYAYFRVYKLYAPNKATLYTVLSVIFNFLSGFFLYKLKDEKRIA